MKTMQDYTCYCTDMQIIRARKLGAPIYVDENGKIKLPTTQQMIGWLREKGFVFGCKILQCFDCYITVEYMQSEQRLIYTGTFEHTCYGQAELAAIDAALDYLENGGEK